MWRPGFDGGYNQTYDIRVYDQSNGGNRVLRVRGERNIEDNQTVITGLHPKTKYTFKVRARNREGFSNFTDEIATETRGIELKLFFSWIC